MSTGNLTLQTKMPATLLAFFMSENVFDRLGLRTTITAMVSLHPFTDSLGICNTA